MDELTNEQLADRFYSKSTKGKVIEAFRDNYLDAVTEAVQLRKSKVSNF